MAYKIFFLDQENKKPMYKKKQRMKCFKHFTIVVSFIKKFDKKNIMPDLTLRKLGHTILVLYYHLLLNEQLIRHGGDISD